MGQRHEIRKRNVTLSVQNVYDSDDDVVGARDAESYTDEKMNAPFKDIEIDFGEDYEKFTEDGAIFDADEFEGCNELFPESRYMLLKKEWCRRDDDDRWMVDLGRDYAEVEVEEEETGEWETLVAETCNDEDDEE